MIMTIKNYGIHHQDWHWNNKVKELTEKNNEFKDVKPQPRQFTPLLCFNSDCNHTGIYDKPEKENKIVKNWREDDGVSQPEKQNIKTNTGYFVIPAKKI